MKLRISLALLNDSGSVASIEGDDLESVTISESRSSQCPKLRCNAAAAALRAAARKFEVLAEMDDPFKRDTQDVVNKQ